MKWFIRLAAAVCSALVVRWGNLLFWRYRRRSHTIVGVVQSGRGAGHILGIRTANLPLALAPRSLRRGLHVCRVAVQGQTHAGLLYYGYNSLTREDCLEVHLLDFNADIYGKQIVVITQRYRRGERRFTTADQLRARIIKDIKRA